MNVNARALLFGLEAGRAHGKARCEVREAHNGLGGHVRNSAHVLCR